MKRLFSFLKFKRKPEIWIGAKEFESYGFIKTENSRYERGSIILQYFPFDNWHVFKGEEDLGRFYTEWALRNRIKEHFNEKL